MVRVVPRRDESFYFRISACHISLINLAIISFFASCSNHFRKQRPHLKGLGSLEGTVGVLSVLLSLKPPAWETWPLNSLILDPEVAKSFLKTLSINKRTCPYMQAIASYWCRPSLFPLMFWPPATLKWFKMAAFEIKEILSEHLNSKEMLLLIPLEITTYLYFPSLTTGVNGLNNCH